MIGVVSLLDDEHRLGYESLAPGNHRHIAVPHISYHMARAYTWDHVRSGLEEIAAETAPLLVVADAVAIFESIPAVVYLTVNDERPLRDLQRKVYARMRPHAQEPDDHYTPHAWVPRITISAGIDPQEATKLAQSLRSKKIQWNIRIENLAFVKVDHGDCLIGGRTAL
ncbi:MAG: 2'-5' RNA ligase family protein [Candidatus Eremiobacteraeota bacterium]|nr:2'-5' RNA ligase family protein [Candidatus Eremiobacteraeota bacterium]